MQEPVRPALPFSPLHNFQRAAAGAIYRRARGVRGKFSVFLRRCRISTYFGDQVTGRLVARSGRVCTNLSRRV
jgi:hypothetical protein